MPTLVAVAGSSRVPPQFTTPSEALTVDAWVYVAPGATFQLHADPASSTWPQTITAVEPARLWKTLDRDGFAYELRAEPGPASYEADWPVVAMGPKNTSVTPCSGSRWPPPCSVSTST